jgi:hypothetical protein
MADGKGMSKGCTVALIVAGVIVVLLIIAIAVVYFFWGDLVKTGTTQVMTQAKTLVAKDMPEGVDTTQFNALSDAFVERFTNDPEMTADKYGPIIQQFQGIIADDQVTSAEVTQMQDAMVTVYPDLSALLGPTGATDDMPVDSMTIMEDSL